MPIASDAPLTPALGALRDWHDLSRYCNDGQLEIDTRVRLCRPALADIPTEAQRQ
ncbi:hypothetical protein [Pandoraea pnomenusa]|uniref:hypothetical protein n=1 Tax=Pandoraea pnomenusa TaxID=93220 RepID=UPI001AC49D96|nr:hypothetical protein [Pandoraea pnomenusa]MBN9091754.1 hypothetical protein [Pandoraea pnomenusa]